DCARAPVSPGRSRSRQQAWLKLQELGPVRTCSAPRLRGLTQQRIPASIQWPLKPIFLVLWRPLAFVGNHARHRRRNARFARHATRLFSHVRSEEHTSELQSRRDLVCRLLLEKKKKIP